MRKMGYGLNSYYETASIYFEYAPFWVFALDRFFDYLCWIIPPISIPLLVRISEDDADELDDGKLWVRMDKWYGDLRQYFCAKVHMPISDFLWSKTERRTIEVDYNKLKDIVYSHDKKFWDEVILISLL